jgi:hypothetical protein
VLQSTTWRHNLVGESATDTAGPHGADIREL